MSETKPARDSFVFACAPETTNEILSRIQPGTENGGAENGPDLLIAYHPTPPGKIGLTSTRFRTTFYPTTGRGNTVHCVIGNELFTFDPGGKKRVWSPPIRARNKRAGYSLPPEFADELAALAQSLGTAHPLQGAPVTQVPNDPASVLFGEVISNGAIWQTNENEGYKFAQRGGAIVTYHADIETSNGINEQILKTLDAQFAAMKGDLVADVADILFWHWYANGRPKPHAEITLAQVLEYRDVKARPNVIEEHWQAMRDVRACRLRGPGIESEALFHISAAATEPPKLQRVYRYHPGYFLAEAIQRDAFFIAYYARCRQFKDRLLRVGGLPTPPGNGGEASTEASTIETGRSTAQPVSAARDRGYAIT